MKPESQAIDGYELAGHMGIAGRPFLVDFDAHSSPWSWRKDRYSARQLAELWRRQLARPDADPEVPVALYIHTPFCTHTCSFCRCFRMQLKSGRPLLDRYADYLLDQMDFFAPALAGKPVRFFSAGGGTPSLLPAAHWRRILRRLSERYDLRRDSPVSTFELSVPTARDEMLDVLAEAGVPRVSMGVQTLAPELRRASRMFALPPATLADRVAAARRRGLRVNLDLVLGLPGETAERFLEGFRLLLTLRPSTVCVNILNGNHFDARPGAPGSPGYLKTVGEGLARLSREAGYSATPHANHMEAVIFMSRAFEEEVAPHRGLFKRLAAGVLSVRAGTSVMAFGSVCSQALLPDYLVSCFDQEYGFDPDKVVYQCSRKEVFSILYPKAEDQGAPFDAAQARSLAPALERLRSVRGLEVMDSWEDVLLEFADAAQEEGRGRVFIRPFEPGKPCSARVGSFALAYNGVRSAATEKVLAAARRTLEEALAR